MNNEQFRRLVGGDSKKSAAAQSRSNGENASSPAPSSLGSRQRASIPMTPRSVGGGRSEFARQLAARDQANRTQKKFKTSAPKGSRLAEGYVDRAKAREAEVEDEKTRRIEALEDMLKNEEIDQATFDKQREQIAGGDISSTHLVRGLDFKLLQRVKQGENVYDSKNEDQTQEAEAEPAEDVDDELDRFEERDIPATTKAGDDSAKMKKKKGQYSTAGIAPGKKRTRDQIIAEMKAAREAAKEQQRLGGRFSKIGAKQKAGTRFERDSKGREVMIIVDEDGHEKRKVRKLNPEEEAAREREMMMPDKNAAPLGMEVPEYYKNKMAEEAELEDENEDIFGDAGSDYDPLAGMDSDSDSNEDDEQEGDGERKKKEDNEAREAMPPPAKPAPPKQDYFKGSKTELLSSKSTKAPPSMSDPALQAAFKKAAQLGAAAKNREEGDEDLDDEEARKRAERRKKMLESSRRDDEDLDMGFGTSRFEDEDEGGDDDIKLSNWGDEDGGDEGPRGKAKRKRGPKKRKGDGNNAEDVMRIVEQRKGS